MVVLLARRRSKSYMIFRAISLGLYVLLASAMVKQLPSLTPIFYYAIERWIVGERKPV